MKRPAPDDGRLAYRDPSHTPRRGPAPLWTQFSSCSALVLPSASLPVDPGAVTRTRASGSGLADLGSGCGPSQPGRQEQSCPPGDPFSDPEGGVTPVQAPGKRQPPEHVVATTSPLLPSLSNTSWASIRELSASVGVWDPEADAEGPGRITALVCIQ